MKKIRYIQIMFLFFLFIATGCVKEELEGGFSSNRKMVSIELSFKVPHPETPATEGAKKSRQATQGFSVSFFDNQSEVNTRSDGTTRLYNLWVFQFDEAGNKVVQTKVSDEVDYVNDMATLNVNLVPANNQTLYLVALGKLFNNDLSGIATIEQLEEMSLNYLELNGAVYSSKIKNDEDIPYAGRVDGVDVVQLDHSDKGFLKFDPASSFTGGVLIERLFAKVSLKYKFDVTGYKMTGVILKSVPEQVTINPDKYATMPHITPVYVDLQAETGTDIDAEGYYTLTWYVAQNKQGSNSLIGLESQRNPTNAPADALLMQLWVQHNTNAANYAIYYIYVGNNNTSNFDVEANSEYRLKTLIDLDIATAQNDERVEAYTLSSNVELFASTRSGNGSNSPSGAKYDLDSHYDYRPITITAAGSLVTIEILDTSGNPVTQPANQWLKVSQYSNYTAAVQNNDLTTLVTGRLLVPSQLKYYLYCDEYVDYTTTEKRSLMARVTTVSTDGMKRNTINFTLSQRPIINVGRLGGMLGENSQYESLLGVDQIDENAERYTYATVSTKSVMPFGYTGVLTSAAYFTDDRENGKKATRALAENKNQYVINTKFSGLEQTAPVVNLYQYSYYHTFPARYCYDRNRDENGNGILDPEELKWYLPAQFQLMGIWAQYEFDTFPLLGGYWSTTERNTILYMGFDFQPSYAASSTPAKEHTSKIRCVRDLN